MVPKRGLGNRKIGPRAPSLLPSPTKKSNPGACRPPSEEMVEALLARLRLLQRSTVLHWGLGERKKGGGQGELSLQMTRVGTETGSGACRSEEARRKSLLFEAWGCWGGPGLDRIPRVMLGRGGRPWWLWEGRGESSVPGDRIGGLGLAPCPLARVLTPLCAQEPFIP